MFHCSKVCHYLVIDFFNLFDGFSDDLTELVQLDLLLRDVILNTSNLGRMFIHFLRQVLYAVVGCSDPSVQLDDVLLLFCQFVAHALQT